MNALQLSLFPNTPPEHAGILHPSGSAGFVAVCHDGKPYGKKWIQVFKRPSELDDFLRYEWPHTMDAYISQNRFSNHYSRAVANLLEMDACWVDLDYYKQPELADVHPEEIYERCLLVLEAHRMPAPSLVIASGKGLYLIWLMEPLGFRSEPHWTRAQETLIAVFRDFGADANAKDAARVLRLVGSTNAKNGRSVRVIDGSMTVWNPDLLLPEIVQPQPEQITINPKAPKAPTPKRYTVDASFYYRAGLHGKTFAGIKHNGATLWAGRFFEMRALIAHRWPEGIPEGWRDKALFLSAVALGWLVPPGREIMRREILALHRLCAGQDWKRRKLRNTLASIRPAIERAFKSAKKETILWTPDWGPAEGFEVNPRYRYKTQTMIAFLEISEEEQRLLRFRSLVSESMRREVEARDRAIKRAQGSESYIHGDIQCHDYQTREEYMARDSIEKARPWESEGISRRTWYRRKEKIKEFGK